MRYFTLLSLLLGYLTSFGQLTVTTTTTNISCFGGNDGFATATPTGGTPPYTFSWNTVPVQTTDSVYGLAAGTYIVTVNDGVSIPVSDTVIINQPPLLSASFINVNNTTCFGIGSCDGSATVIATGGTLPYSYTWLPSGNFSTTLVGLCPGIYTVVVTDSNGCMIAPQISITQPTPLSVSFNTTDDTCGLCTGSANVNVFGGSPPYAYSWSTGNTVQWLTGLCAGFYSISVIDGNGCVVDDSTITTTTINLAPGTACGYGTINGTVYYDVNTNCNQDTLENGIGNITIVANPGPYYAMTNSTGDYSLVAPFGNYTITQVLPQYYNEICPVSGSYPITIDSLNNTVANIDFADTIVPIQEVSILLSSGTPRPGFNFSYYLNYSSLSYVPMNGMVSLVTDNLLTFNNASITPDVISGDTLFWNYSNLQMFENRAITATFYVPADVNLLGDTLRACAQITPLIGDVNVTDNTTCYERVIVGSYDPNDKQVFPQGDILQTDTELTYTIRFQNSGTDTAFNVVVIDTLSANLDVTSLRKVMASHPFEYSVSGQGVLTFTFNNILLPDSNVNEPASHGLIEFTIDQKSSNPIGTEIENTAEIYFDFNPPIVTNTVLNTVVLPTNIEEIKFSNTISVYPNPTEGRIKISFNTTYENEVSFALFDITGRKVNELTQNKKMTGTQVLDWNIGNLNSGIYFLSVKIGDKNYINKIVVR